MKNVGPIRYCEPPLHCQLPGVASCTPAIAMAQAACDVHDIDNDDNDNTWQRGPLWPHGMGPIKPYTPCREKSVLLFTYHILVCFQNPLTGRLAKKFLVKQWLHIIPPHLSRVATLACETFLLKNRDIQVLIEVNYHARFSTWKQLMANLYPAILALFWHMHAYCTRCSYYPHLRLVSTNKIN